MANLEKVNISLIRPSAMNPRKTFDQSLIEELAQNIAEQGLLQPITIRGVEYTDFVDEETGEIHSLPTLYEVVCGERRFRAWSLLAEKKPKKYEAIPAIIREMNDKEAFDAMITENLQRKDVDPIEEATAISLLMKRGDSTKDIAIRLGKSERFVTDRVKLAKLTPKLAEALQKGLIPLTGALIIAKLDEEKQDELYQYFGFEHEEEPTTVSRIEVFVERSFGELSDEDFYKEDGFDESFPLCAKCQYNTANAGCLFYEMNCKEPQCTNRKCMKDKGMKYIQYKITQMGDQIVKTGEDLTFGKIAVSVDDEQSWWSDEDKESRQYVLEMLSGLNIDNVSSKLFSSKCCYNIDDPRIKEILDSRKGYKVLHLERCYNQGYKIKEEVWYLNKAENVELPACNLEELKINKKIERNNELKKESITERLRMWAVDKKDYSERNQPLSSAEKIVFSVLLLDECGYQFRREIGLDDEIATKKDEFNYVGKHAEDMAKWMRGFMRNKLANSEVTYSKTLQRCQDMLFADQYPKEYRELVEKIDANYDKKNDRLKEKLETLKKGK